MKIFGGSGDVPIFSDRGGWIKVNMDLSTCNGNCTAVSEPNFKNYMRSGKDFSMPLIWDQPQLPCSIRLEVTALQRQR